MQFKKVLKWSFWTIFSIVCLLLLLTFLVQLPYVQNKIKNVAVGYLQDKLQTEVALDHFYINFPNEIEVDGLFLRDQNQDTLIYANSLRVSINLLDLLHNKADLRHIRAKHLVSNISRDSIGNFNFDYIIKAFASNDSVPVKQETNPFLIELNKIELENIQFSYRDALEKNDISVKFNTLETEFKTFDLNNLAFSTPSIKIDGLQVASKFDALQKKASQSTTDSKSSSKLPTLNVDRIQWTNFNIAYLDYNSNIDAQVIFKELDSKIDKIDLNQLDFVVNTFDLNQANINLKLLESTKSTEPHKAEINNEANPIQIKISELDLNEIAVAYSNLNEKPLHNGLDYNYLAFSKINLNAKNVAYSDQNISANIISGYFNEKSGLEIQELTALFNYKPNSIQVSNFKLKTPKTFIVNQTELRYKSIADLSENLGNTKLEAEFLKSKLAISDLLLVVPSLANQDIFKNNKNATLYLDTKVSGTVNNLLVSRFSFSGIGKTSIRTSGQIKNALNPDQLFVNLNITEAKTTRAEILSFIPKNTIPNTISLPENISVKGKINGSIHDLSSQLIMQTSYGDVDLDVMFDQKQKGNEVYNITGALKSFEVGKLIHNDSIGKLSMTIQAQGTSLEPQKMNATFSSTVADFEYNDYIYKNILLDGVVNNGNYRANICFIDENAEVQLWAKGKLTDSLPTVFLEGDVAKLNLQALNFTSDAIAFETKFHTDFTDLNPDNLNGKLRITELKYITPEKSIAFDTIKVDIQSSQTTNNFYLKSQVIDAAIVGKYKLNTLPALFKQTVSNYFNICEPDTEYIPTDNTYFNANAQIKNDRILFSLLPQLESFETVKINAWYKANASSFNISADLPNLIYGANNFSNITFDAYTVDEKIDYNFSIAFLETQAYRIRNISMAGQASNDELNYLFTIKNKDLVDQYKIQGSLFTQNEFFDLKLNPKGILLNYESWQVAENNSISWSNEGVLAQNFKLSNEKSNLIIESAEPKYNAPLNITFKDFKVEDITHIIKKDSLAAKGVINGYVEFDDIKSDFDFTGNIQVANLEYNTSKLGDLSLNISKSEKQDVYLGTLKLLGEGNNVVFTGNFDSQKNSFSLQAVVSALQLSTVQGFSNNQISKTTGNVSGIMFIKGAPHDLSVLGQIKFNDVGLTINTLNAPLKNINKSIVFNHQGIVFDNFEVTDIENNKLTLDGKILTTNYQDFKFDLNLDSKNFAVMNSTAKNNELFYGKMYIDLGMSIKGTSTLPLVDGKISINKNTDFTIVLPSSDPSIADREGIVEFVDTNDFIFNNEIEADTQLSQSNIKGLNLNAAISVSKEATLNIIVDKQHGDKLILNGSAQLVGGVDPSGGTTLTGTYEIESGSYDMTFNFIKRKFDIKKGSYIIWTGEPTSAIANITAIYKTNVAPIDLLSSQIQGMSQSEQNLYKQRIPVETLLQLSGELLKPTLSFNIELPANNYNVSTDVYNAVDEKLKQMRNDEAEMNKQVIALLIFNRFIGTSSLSSAAGGSVSSIARQSVSNLVSEELNSIASHLVTGFDLNFDLDTTEDYSTGKKANRTDLNVEVSKRLFDDRLKITVGSNFGLEGEERENEQTTNIAGDISAEYMLTEDGRYMVRVYRKNTYQVAFQGQVVETGVGFIITMNYNTYKEYVRKNKEAREQRKLIKAEQKKQKSTEKAVPKNEQTSNEN